MKIIPLVIHVVYRTPKENISDAQIKNQIDSLNADFGRTNVDRNQTPEAFKPVAVDTGIRFCIAKVIRKQTSVSLFNYQDDRIKSCARGGDDPVDVTKYMNVWVCNLGNTTLGYGEFPNTRVSNTYGVVINYGAFGSMGTARSPYNKGRTLTHEISHCLGVYHVFSEAGFTNSCSKTDRCADIPAQSTPTLGACPSFPKLDNCSAQSPGIMFMNFMDYTDDRCMNLFTKDQSDRMNAVLSITPYNNLGADKCTPISGDINCGIISPAKVSPTPTTKPMTMTNNNTMLFFLILSALILFFIWRADWSTKIKIIYTIIYVAIGGTIYYKVLYNKDNAIGYNIN